MRLGPGCVLFFSRSGSRTVHIMSLGGINVFEARDFPESLPNCRSLLRARLPGKLVLFDRSLYSVEALSLRQKGERIKSPPPRLSR